MTRTAVRTITFMYKSRKILSTLLMFLCIAMSAFYLYCIVSTIADGVALKSVRADIVEKEREINELDETLLSMKNKVTIELAAEKGFSSAEVSLFIPGDTSLGLSFNK